MITRLSIQGLAIIDSLAIDFSPGFNVITGETGAGKSILIKGLHFLMGGKAAADTVRKGASQALVVGEFTVPEGHPVLQILDGLGIPTEETEGGFSIVVRRLLTAKGRSQSWVNDIPLTSQPLREVGTLLVDVFGQHENQRLMEESQHIRYVDQFLADKGCRMVVERLQQECTVAIGKIRERVESFFSRGRDQDYLKFRCKELEEFAPTAEDYEQVSLFCRQSDQVSHIRDTLARATAYLDGAEGESGAARAIWEAAKALGTGEDLAALRTRLQALGTEVEDVSFELGKRLSTLDFSEEDLEAKQARLYGYQELFRKHATASAEALSVECDRLKLELDFLENAAESLEKDLMDLDAKSVAWSKAFKELSKARRTIAQQTKKRVEAELQELAMPGSVFEIDFQPQRRAVEDLDFAAISPKLAGQWQEIKATLESNSESCRFLLAPNPGEPILPLTRVASGGELSRIMLALKKALIADAETCVLVFDEIDTGISGRVADVVGRKMQELAKEFQVICISHLPQVAVYADTHFQVKKIGKAERTESTIVRLTSEQSAREIARLLSGAQVSDSSLRNAEALISKARRPSSRSSMKQPRA